MKNKKKQILRLILPLIINGLVLGFFLFNTLFFLSVFAWYVCLIPSPNNIDFSAVWNIPLLAELVCEGFFYGSLAIINLILCLFSLMYFVKCLSPWGLWYKTRKEAEEAKGY